MTALLISSLSSSRRSADGKPVNLENLPVKGLPFPDTSNHVQYKAAVSKHQLEDHQFEREGRNGFVSRLDLEGDRPEADS